jgi:hypothetical protein
MADDAERLKIIADNIETMYQALRRAAANIAGLLQGGQATCDEVKAYNLWALATYNTQRGMLATLRAAGEQGVPDLPTAPTLFTWRGVQGADAWNIDCGSSDMNGLRGLMDRAMKGPGKTPRYLSSQDIEVTTQDQFAFNPTAAPSFATLVAIQKHRAQDGLGFVGVLIAIAGIAIAVAVAVAAIMHYLETSEVEESNTKQTAIQAEAFANYTQARLACLSQCTSSGKSTEDCVDICRKIVDKPDIKLPGQMGQWGTLQWIGFTVVAGVGMMIAWKLFMRHREGKPLFVLPESVDAAIHPQG